MGDHSLANHPLANTEPNALDGSLARIEQQISDLWAHSPGSEHGFATWEQRYIIPVFEALRDISARSLFLALTNPGPQASFLDKKIQDTIASLVADILSWATAQPDLPASLLSKDFRKFREVQTIRSDSFARLTRQVRQFIQEWFFQIDGHDLNLSEIRTLLQHMPIEDKESLWRQLLPQLDRLGIGIVEQFDRALVAQGAETEHADPLVARYRLTPGFANKLRSAADGSARKARRTSLPSCPPAAGITILDDPGVSIAERAHDWMRLAYRRYLPGLELFLDDFLARAHCTFEMGEEACSWPLNVSFDQPLQHWIFVPGADPLDQLFDFAHHLGHGLHQDLAGGDGLYRGALPDSHNEILPLLNEMLLREILLDSPLLNATDMEILERHAAHRWERGVWREWDLDRLQSEVVRCSARGLLNPRKMERLWHDHVGLEISDPDSQLFHPWQLECDRLFDDPAVSSNALGGVMAAMILPAVLAQPEAGSLTLLEQLKRGAEVTLEQTLESFQQLARTWPEYSPERSAIP